MKRRSTISWLLILISIIAWFGVVNRQIKTFSGQLLQAKARSIEVDSYKQRLADVEFTKNQGEAIQGTLRALYLAMPKSSQIPESLVMIESLGNTAGVVFGTASVGNASGTEVPVSITFTGSLDNVNSFLDALNNNIRTAIVKNQTVSADKTGNLAVTLQLGLVYQGGK